MTKGKWIPVTGAEGRHSKQAHSDMPEGTYEREMSKEGFFGPAAFFHHPKPPTGWTSFVGPLRPRAFDLTKTSTKGEGAKGDGSGPWHAPVILSNKAVEVRYWKLAAPMTRLSRNGDGDTLLFIHSGAADFYSDWGHYAAVPGDYIYVPRGGMFFLK